MRKKICVISTRVFWPTNSGHKVVLYNYCKKKSFIEAWCIENAALVEGPVDVNELVELYMLGYIKQKR